MSTAQTFRRYINARLRAASSNSARPITFIEIINEALAGEIWPWPDFSTPA